MPLETIKNTTSAFGLTTLNQTADRVVITAPCDAAVTAGDVLAWTTQTTDDAPTVHPHDISNDNEAVVAGIAINTAASGDLVKIVRSGPALVNIGSGTVALGERVIATTDAGIADGVAADAATIEGDTFGVWLGAEVGTTNQAVADIHL